MFAVNIYNSVDIIGSNRYLLSGEMILIWKPTYMLYIDRKVKKVRNLYLSGDRISINETAFGTKLRITSSYLTVKLLVSNIIFPE